MSKGNEAMDLLIASEYSNCSIRPKPSWEYEICVSGNLTLGYVHSDGTFEFDIERITPEDLELAAKLTRILCPQ